MHLTVDTCRWAHISRVTLQTLINKTTLSQLGESSEQFGQSWSNMGISVFSWTFIDSKGQSSWVKTNTCTTQCSQNVNGRFDILSDLAKNTNGKHPAGSRLEDRNDLECSVFLSITACKLSNKVAFRKTAIKLVGHFVENFHCKLLAFHHWHVTVLSIELSCCSD